MFQSHEVPQFPSSSISVLQDFHGSGYLMRRSVSYTDAAAEEEISDDGSQILGGLGEKKRRLNTDQVRTLERSFELGNKLEPERKMELARGLGLEPRQIAIWFQNRRARWKIKQLEKDYEMLKREFQAIKADNDALKLQNKKLQSQILGMKTRESNLKEGSDNSSEVDLNTSLLTNQPTKHVFFPPAPVMNHGGSIPEILHEGSRVVPSEGFCSNMFGGVEEKYEYWPWT